MNQVSTLPADAPVSHVPAVARLPIFAPGMMQSALQLAEGMASADGLVPGHLLGNKGACLAVAVQAINWHQDPFALAQASYYMPETKRVSYMARAIASACVTTGNATSEPEFEYFGDWERIEGRFDASDWKRPKRLWSPDEEQGLGVICRATLARTGKVVEKRLTLAEIATRNSPLWATDPRQQLAYQAVVRLVRLHMPSVLMGVSLGHDEARDMGRVVEVPTTPEGKREALNNALAPIKARVTGEALPSLPEVLTHIEMADTLNKLESCIQMAARLPSETEKATARAAYREKNRMLKGDKPEPAEPVRTPDPVATEPPEDSARTRAEPPVSSYAEVRDALEHADTVEALDEAADLIGAVPNEDHRAELVALYRSLKGE